MQTHDELENHEKIYRVFINWYAMPKESRKPDSIDGFCEHFGIDKSVIAEFTQREDYTDDLYRASIAWGKSKVPELLHILYRKYLQSNSPNDLRMYKELLSLDKVDNKKKDDKESSRNGLLRELFEASRPR